MTVTRAQIETAIYRAAEGVPGNLGVGDAADAVMAVLDADRAARQSNAVIHLDDIAETLRTIAAAQRAVLDTVTRVELRVDRLDINARDRARAASGWGSGVPLAEESYRPISQGGAAS